MRGDLPSRLGCFGTKVHTHDKFFLQALARRRRDLRRSKAGIGLRSVFAYNSFPPAIPAWEISDTLLNAIAVFLGPDLDDDMAVG